MAVGTRAQQWEECYASVERLWSGQPNEWLTGLAQAWEPGAALDVGRGEGDVSPVAAAAVSVVPGQDPAARARS